MIAPEPTPGRGDIHSRRALLGGVAGAAALAALPGHAGRAAAAGPATLARGITKPTTDLLAVTGPGQPRWLSVPMSRIVANPYDFNQTTSEVVQNSGPELPLSAGYYAHDEANRVPSMLMLFRRPPGEPHPEPPPVAFDDDFDELAPEWEAEPGVSAQVVDSRLTMVLPDDAPNAWGALSHTLTVDVDAFPVVTIEVPSVAGAWALKVNDGSAPVDTVLQGDTSGAGSFSYDLTKATGWSGVQTFSLRLFVVQKNAPLVVDRITVQGQPTSWLEPAERFSTTWRPEALEFSASYAGGGAVRGRDQFHDAGSLTRVLTVDGLGVGGASLQLAGRYVGQVSHEPDRGVLTVSTDTFSYSICVGARRTVEFFASETDLRAGGPTVSPAPPSGYWSVRAPARDTTVVGVGFVYRGEDPGVSVARALAASEPAVAGRDLRRWRDYWNSVLARVPHPRDFALPAVAADGVTAEDVASTYYRAWHFLAANLLPAGPEVGFSYPQVATGKPSMWNFGAPGSRPSASWDSLLGIQYLAYLDADAAWGAFQGLMSLVDESGKLGGESLPSRKAQTAWILSSVTGDQGRLAAIYADLRRYLLWAEANPRWIFGDHDIPDERDAEFVASLIIDFGYAERIAAAVGADADIAFWRRHAADLTRDYLTWFFPTTGTNRTLQYHYLDGSHADSAGNTLWVCTGLHLRNLPEGESRLLRDRFLAGFDPTATLAGWGFPDVKAPDVTFTAYGLLESGLTEQADVFVQANVRDIVRAGMFAEVYDDPPGGPVGTGVRPSMFGAVNLIDFVWLRNGYRADDGEPLFVRLPSADGGVSGLTHAGDTLNVDLDEMAGLVLLSGRAVRGGQDCRRLAVPIGVSTAIPEGCRREG
ncbi:hypothetical protein [Actinopolymorpha pittospori]|uniref:Uncharacterized protein n=1 Tax=Actinopolymorpha pittospori TaxID=648752 RepID=A0A927N1Z4_9ACTN|nr:hypothetical protein [Actinopolymorpha pittospori]MBE1607437.1 hypothetical protein [Actinopolymorpha pittospori]